MFRFNIEERGWLRSAWGSRTARVRLAREHTHEKKPNATTMAWSVVRARKMLIPAGARVALMSRQRVTAPGVPQQLSAAPAAMAISTWERVRTSMWHPMATVEQSLMDMERLTSQLLSGRAFPFSRTLLPRMHTDEDDFFHDLEVSSSADKTKDNAKAEQPQSADAADSGQSYSSYSFSSSTVLDSDGHRVSTVRRRYEDSTGRLKAVHEREIDGKKLKDVWRREHADDKGEHHSCCVGGSSEEFEEEWKQTPFGQAAEHGKQQELGSSKSNSDSNGKEHEEHGKERKRKDLGGSSSDPELAKLAEQNPPKSAFGVDTAAAEAAPDKECGKEAEGATKEAKERSRDEAIAQGSKTQEEETTPPSYS